MLHNLYMSTYLDEGACKKGEEVMLTVEAKGAFTTLKRACLKAPVLAFADFSKPWVQLPLIKTGIPSTKVGNFRAVSGVPSLETVHCQDQ